jgi:transcriptional regulator of heat shock response
VVLHREVAQRAQRDRRVHAPGRSAGHLRGAVAAREGDIARRRGDLRHLLIRREGAREGQGCRIFIGSENRMFALSGSSVIAAPYREAGGKVVGVIGVIGPTRLNYARIVPMVDFTAQALSRLIRP